VPRLPDDEQKIIGARLRELRRAFGFDVGTEWASWVGIGYTAWHNYEVGSRLVPVLELRKIAAKTGVSFDWVYQGLEHANPDHVNKRLARLREMDRENAAIRQT
jgi:hypothetical protein